MTRLMSRGLRLLMLALLLVWIWTRQRRKWDRQLGGGQPPAEQPPAEQRPGTGVEGSP